MAASMIKDGRICIWALSGTLLEAGPSVSQERPCTRTFASQFANRVANKVATSSANFSAIRPAISLAIQVSASG